MSSNPRPRPAFDAADDTASTVSASAIAPVVEPAPRRKDNKATSKDKHPKVDGKEVALVLHLPKPVRKRLRAKAAELGMSADEAAAHVVRMWVDG